MLHTSSMLRMLFLLATLAAIGCGKSTKDKLADYWHGAPDVTQAAVDQMASEIKAETDLDDESQEVAANLAAATAKIASRGGKGMDLTLKSDGIAEFGRHTEILGLQKTDTAGTWELVKDEPENIVVRMGTAAHMVEGKVKFRDNTAFFFTYEAPIDAPTELHGVGPVVDPNEEKPKTKLVTLLFRR